MTDSATIASRSSSGVQAGDPSSVEVAQTVAKLEKLASESTQVLFTCSSVFPFELFPTRLIIDKTKVDIERQIFFASKAVETILIKDIFSVAVETDLLFASLVLIHRLPNQPQVRVKFLSKKDAFRCQHILEGLMVVDNENVDLSHVPAKQVVDRLEVIGKTRRTA